MLRLRRWSAPFFLALAAPVVGAEDRPEPAWAVDRTLLVAPRGEPVPALKYRFAPLSSELKEGNAVPIYLRLVHEQSDAARKYWAETPKAWNALPIDKLPLAEAEKFLRDHRYMLGQLELGARRRTAAWEYTLDAGDPIGLLLPDVQAVRNYAPMLVLQARVALARGDFAAAAHHLETGFAFCRHIAQGPTLIHRLVALALARDFAGVVADFAERPGSPNLYWALTTVPRPLIDLRPAEEWEYTMAVAQLPELGQLTRERTPDQWDTVLANVRMVLRRMATEGPEGAPKVPEWFPKDIAPWDPATKAPDLPAARKFVARSRGLSAEQAEALPPAQALLLYMVGTYAEDRDDLYRAAYLSAPQALPLFAAADRRLRDAPATEGHLLARIFLPALSKVASAQSRVERTLASLRVVEAVRLYAAAHGGRLPDALADVTEAPVPDDPGTGRPFLYRRDGDTAEVVSQVPGDPLPRNGIRYRVKLQRR